MRQQQQLWSNFIAVGQVLNGQHSISTNYSLRKEVNPQEKKTGRAGVARLCECFYTETGRQTRNNRPENNVLAATPPIQNAVKTLTQHHIRPSLN